MDLTNTCALRIHGAGHSHILRAVQDSQIDVVRDLTPHAWANRVVPYARDYRTAYGEVFKGSNQPLEVNIGSHVASLLVHLLVVHRQCQAAYHTLQHAVEHADYRTAVHMQPKLRALVHPAPYAHSSLTTFSADDAAEFISWLGSMRGDEATEEAHRFLSEYQCVCVCTPCCDRDRNSDFDPCIEFWEYFEQSEMQLRYDAVYPPNQALPQEHRTGIKCPCVKWPPVSCQLGKGSGIDGGTQAVNLNRYRANMANLWEDFGFSDSDNVWRSRTVLRLIDGAKKEDAKAGVVPQQAQPVSYQAPHMSVCMVHVSVRVYVQCPPCLVSSMPSPRMYVCMYGACLGGCVCSMSSICVCMYGACFCGCVCSMSSMFCILNVLHLCMFVWCMFRCVCSMSSMVLVECTLMVDNAWVFILLHLGAPTGRHEVKWCNICPWRLLSSYT